MAGALTRLCFHYPHSLPSTEVSSFPVSVYLPLRELHLNKVGIQTVPKYQIVQVTARLSPTTGKANPILVSCNSSPSQFLILHSPQFDPCVSIYHTFERKACAKQTISFLLHVMAWLIQLRLRALLLTPVPQDSRSRNIHSMTSTPSATQSRTSGCQKDAVKSPDTASSSQASFNSTSAELESLHTFLGRNHSPSNKL